MQQIDPEVQALRSCHHTLQRLDHLSLLKGQFQCYGVDDMLIGNHLQLIAVYVLQYLR